MRTLLLNIITINLIQIKASSAASSTHKVVQTPAAMVIEQNSTGVHLSCSHQISDYYTILWYQRSPGGNRLELIGFVYYLEPTVEASFKGHFTVNGDGAKSSELNLLTLRRPEDTAEYYCAASMTYTQPAYFGPGTKLTVLDPNLRVTPPTVEVLPPSEKECQDPNRKKKKTLVCVASKFYPDHVTVSWFVDDTVITSGVTTDHNAQRKKDHYQITSRLRVTAKEWHAQKEFKCTVSFFNGTETTNHSSSVEGDPKGRKNTEGMTREKFMKVTQTAKLSYCVFIVKNMVYGLFVTVVAWKLGLGRSHATAKK